MYYANNYSIGIDFLHIIPPQEALSGLKAVSEGIVTTKAGFDFAVVHNLHKDLKNLSSDTEVSSQDLLGFYLDFRKIIQERVPKQLPNITPEYFYDKAYTYNAANPALTKEFFKKLAGQNK